MNKFVEKLDAEFELYIAKVWDVQLVPEQKADLKKTFFSGSLVVIMELLTTDGLSKEDIGELFLYMKEVLAKEE